MKEVRGWPGRRAGGERVGMTWPMRQLASVWGAAMADRQARHRNGASTGQGKV